MAVSSEKTDVHKRRLSSPAKRRSQYISSDILKTFHLLMTVAFYVNILEFDSLIDNTNECARINPLKTKLTPLYLKTQSVPRCKRF